MFSITDLKSQNEVPMIVDSNALPLNDLHNHCFSRSIEGSLPARFHTGQTINKSSIQED